MVIHKIKSFLKGKPDNAPLSPEAQILVVDGNSLARGKGRRLNPRIQLGLLRSLSQVSQQEQIRVVVVFEGEPLRAVEDGKHFDEIMPVYYADDESAVVARIEKAVREEGRGKMVTVVTSLAPMRQKALSAGWQSMEGATFSKLFGLDRGSRGDGGGRGGREGRESREGGSEGGHKSGNRRRRNRRGEGRGGDREKSKAEGSSEKPAAKSTDPVSDLIDLV